MLSVVRSSEDSSQPELMPEESVLFELTGCLCAVYLDESSDDIDEEEEDLDDGDNEHSDEEDSTAVAKAAYSFECTVMISSKRLLVMDDSLMKEKEADEAPMDRSLGIHHSSVAFHGLSSNESPQSLFISLDECFVSSLQIIPLGAHVDSDSLQSLYEALNEGQMLNPPSDMTDNENGDEDQAREALIREDMAELTREFGEGLMIPAEELITDPNEDLASLVARIRQDPSQLGSEEDYYGDMMNGGPQRCLDLSELEENTSGAVISDGVVISDELNEEQRRQILEHLDSVTTVVPRLDESEIVSEMLAEDDDDGNDDQHASQDLVQLYDSDGEQYSTNRNSVLFRWCCEPSLLRELHERDGQFDQLTPEQDPTYEMFEQMYSET